MTSSSQKKNSFCLRSTFHENSTALIAVRPVTTAITRLMPSAARWYSMPSEGIHGIRATVSKMSPDFAWKNSAIAIVQPAIAVASASQHDKARGRSSTASAPANEM